MSAPTGDNSMRAKPSLVLATAFLGAVAAFSAPADAACKKFGFTVNDYGKEGPTNDAKNLLDKHISEWASQNGVANYQTGKKSVSCELFLDVILFDEYTCTASATVCWGDDAKKLGQQSADANADVAQDGATPPAPVSKAAALGIPAQPQQAAAAPVTGEEEGSEQADAAPAPQADDTPAAIAAAPHEAEADGPPVALDTAPAAAAVATTATEAPPAAGTAATGAAPAAVETGALQAGAGMVAPPAAPHAAPATATPSAEERAAAAAAAATAAAAAERAAAAAETAANAAKEAAAAAVAASAASKAKASATVAPLDHTAGVGGSSGAQ